MKTESTPLLDQINRSDQITHHLERDETLFAQGSRTRGLFYLLDGKIDLTRHTQSGHRILVHRARAGELFAEASLFAPSFHCTATAISSARVIEYKREAVDQLMSTDIKFMQSLVSRFARQIQHGRRRIELLSIKAAEERVMAAIADGILLDDIASFSDSIGLASETVYRSLALLTKQGQLRKVARGRYEMVAPACPEPATR